MLIDACLMLDEHDLLELRLRTLEQVVDRFVVVTSPITHQGQPAPEFDALAERWKPWPLTHYRSHVDVPKMRGRGGAGTTEYQKVEKWHRDCVTEAVKVVTDDPGALVIVSDVDEIPFAHTFAEPLDLLDRMSPGHEWLVLEQRFHSGSLDVLHPQQPWLGSELSRVRDLKPQAMRDARPRLYEQGDTIKAAGVHLSWLGTDQQRQSKLDSFSHYELHDWDPAEGRRTLTHANGEVLRTLTMEEMECMTWPRVLFDGSFSIPASWWSEP